MYDVYYVTGVTFGPNPTQLKAKDMSRYLLHAVAEVSIIVRDIRYTL